MKGSQGEGERRKGRREYAIFGRAWSGPGVITMKKLSALAVFPLLVFACSGSSETDDEDGGVRAFVADYCDAFMPCCAAASLPTDGAECRTLLGDLTLDNLGFDEDAASECSEWLETLNGTDLCRGAVTPVAACGNVFTPKGNRAPGESCDTFWRLRAFLGRRRSLLGRLSDRDRGYRRKRSMRLERSRKCQHQFHELRRASRLRVPRR